MIKRDSYPHQQPQHLSLKITQDNSKQEEMSTFQVISKSQKCSNIKFHDKDFNNQQNNLKTKYKEPQQLLGENLSQINSKRLSIDKNDRIVDEVEKQILWQKIQEILKRIKLNKYIKAFLSLSRIRLLKQLTPSQIQKINDQSFYEANFQTNSKKKELEYNKNKDQSQYKKNIWKFIESIKIPIFSPHHFLFEFWQFLKICSILICFYCYLVCFSFNQDLNKLFPSTLLVLCQTCIVLDIFITTNTGIYIRGILCTDRKEVFKYYKSSKTFYYDIISSFFTSLFYFLYYNLPNSHRLSKVLLLTIIFKLNDFYIVIKKIQQKFLLDRRAQNIIGLLNLVKNILVISHIFACIWILVGLASQQNYSQIESSSSETTTPHNWLALMNLENEMWYIQYLNSYYYIAVTMSTVGYGDIRPTNPIEIIVAVFIVMTCSVIFGFTLNSIGEIVQDFFQFEKQIQEKRYVIANYMDKNYINNTTRKNIFEYLEYYWKEQLNENTKEENYIICQLSDNLKEELLIQSNRLILKENKVFKEYFSSELLAKCIPIIKEQRYIPNEIVLDSSEGNTDCSIYFILFGEVEAIYGTNISKMKNKSKNEIQILKRGDSFGEVSFFTGNTDSLNFVSKGFSKILKIKRGDFINLVRSDSVQNQIFCKLNDKLIQSSDISLLNLKCSSCQSNSHDVKTCPSLHYIPRKFKILATNQMSQLQKRNNKFYRKRDYKQGSLQSLEIFNEVCYSFIEQNIEDIFQYESTFLEFKHFLKPKIHHQSEDESDYFQQQKPDIEIAKLKKLVNNDQPDSSDKPKKRLSYIKKYTGYLKQSTDQLGGSIKIQNEDSLKDSTEAKVQELIQGIQKKGSIHEDGLQDIVLKKEFSDYDKKADGNKIVERLNYNPWQSFQKKQNTLDTTNNHQKFEICNNKKEYTQKFSKIQVTELSSKREQQKNQKDESQQFDLFLGNFEKMTSLTHYFPKFNYENVINSMDKTPLIPKSQRIIMKDNFTQMNRKSKERKLQSLLNQRDTNSITRIKGHSDSIQSNDRDFISKLNITPILKQYNDLLSLEFKERESMICNSSLNQISNLDNNVKIQIYLDEPQSPPRNEINIPYLQTASVLNFKNSFKKFETEEYSTHQLNKQDI